MKISVGRQFDAGRILEAFAKAKVNGVEDFITYFQDFSTQVINAIRGTLTIEENLNSLVKEIQLTHNVRLQMELPDKKKMPKHAILTKVIPFENAALSFNWQITQDGSLEVLGTFTGTPVQPVTVTMVILF